jgi:hypothetical protein
MHVLSFTLNRQCRINDVVETHWFQLFNKHTKSDSKNTCFQNRMKIKKSKSVKWKAKEKLLSLNNDPNVSESSLNCQSFSTNPSNFDDGCRKISESNTPAHIFKANSDLIGSNSDTNQGSSSTVSSMFHTIPTLSTKRNRLDVHKSKRQMKSSIELKFYENDLKQQGAILAFHIICVFNRVFHHVYVCSQSKIFRSWIICSKSCTNGSKNPRLDPYEVGPNADMGNGFQMRAQ